MFEIPVYKSVQIYRMYVKPIVYQSIALILQTQEKYIVLLNNKYIFFDEISYNTNCFIAKQSRFCVKSEKENTCEIDVLSKIYSDSKCFRKLSHRNTITKIEEETYFTIFSPLIIQIQCGNTNFSIRMTKNLKIINKNHCSINATFFQYTKDLNYGIFIENKSDQNPVWSHISNPINWQIYLDLAYFFLFILFCGLSIGITIYFKKLRIRKMEEQSRVRVRLSNVFEPYIRQME